MMKTDFYDSIVAYIVDEQNKFYRLAYSYLRNRDDALDAVQNAVCKALEHYRDIKNQEAVKTWFYRILINESINILKEKHRLTYVYDENKDRIYEEKGFEPGFDAKDCLSRLDIEAQTIIKLRFFEDLSLNEIAKVTGLNINTVKSKLYRGLKQMKICLKEDEL